MSPKGTGVQPWPLDQGVDAGLLQVAVTGFAAGWDPEVVGVAVSGGSDSMAMLHLMARAAPHAGWRLEAVTVDHRLRDEAAEEAAFVARTCAGLGVPHQTLVWEDHPMTGNLMQAASRARYDLIAGWAKARGVELVAIGHTADDQAETFLMALARASGLDGLSGMREDWDIGGVSFRRPFIRTTRADLRMYLVRHGLEWRDDPSNDDARYTRVKARRALEALRPLGITAEQMGRSILHLGMVRSQLLSEVYVRFTMLGREEAGAIVCSRHDFGRLYNEMDRIWLVAALRWLSGSAHPPRAESVERIRKAIALRRNSTLAGCSVRVVDDQLLITREPRAVATLSTPTDAPWDNRWHLSGPHAPDLTIRALGADGLRACKDWRDTGLPREVLIVSPAVWRGDTLVAAPLAGWAQGWTATVSPSFAATILAH